jgi:hypothetical protein
MPPGLTLDRMTPEQFEAIAAYQRSAAAAQKSASGTPTSYLLHGNGGLLTTPGVDQALFATVVRPTGILGNIPWYKTVYTNPLFSIITGVRADTGTERSTACGDCLTAGIKKVCTQTAVFGKYCRETREFNVNTLGARLNRGDPDDLRLLNPIYGGTNLPMQVGSLAPLSNDIAQALVEVAISFERLLGPQLWTGNPANNNGTAYMEFPGLDILVSTGKVDALDNTSCPSVNSDIKDYNYQDVCTGSPSIVETLSYLYRYVSKIARTTALDPVDFRFVMREELFYELTSCWPCAYSSFRCNTLTVDTAVTGMMSDMLRMRDDMRNGRYLLVDGKQIPVLLDDGIPEDTNTNNANLQAGEFSSDIYLLPFSAMGGQIATLYGEYFDYTVGQGWLRQVPGGLGGDQYFTSDGGMYSWTFSRINNCILWLAEIQPRVILRTPFLAGKLQNVRYTPLQHTREPFPTDGYFVDGGRVTTTTQTFYSEWRGQE